LALKEKNFPDQGAGLVSKWIPELLAQRLSPDVGESPAVFSLLGSQMRLLVYVLPTWIRGNLDLLLPPDRLDCLDALIDGHLAYDQPHKFVVETVPELLGAALDLVERRAKSASESSDEGDRRRDIGSRLGFHISFYAWNDWFTSPEYAENLLSRFRSVATASARAETLGHIGSVFEKTEAGEEVDQLFDRAREILDRWLQWIEESMRKSPDYLDNYEAELGQFADLVAAECFPFSWRVNTASRALSLIKSPSRSFQLLDTLEHWAEQGDENPERLAASIRLLATLTGKLSTELRWSIRSVKISPILRRGLAHDDPGFRAQATVALENLLRHGFYDLLDLVDDSECKRQ